MVWATRFFPGKVYQLKNCCQSWRINIAFEKDSLSVLYLEECLRESFGVITDSDLQPEWSSKWYIRIIILSMPEVL